MSLVFFSGDDHFLLVLAVSVLLCLTCLCLLVRKYRTKNRYRGKEKEIQRPFLKGNRGPRSPRSTVLFGNLFTSAQSERTPKGQQYGLTGKHLKPLVNTSIFKGKPQTSRIVGRSFLANVITSIDQQHHKHLSSVEMEKRLAQTNIELKVLSTSHHLQEQSKEKQKSNPKREQDDTPKAYVTTEDASDKFFDSQNDTTTKKPLHSTENPRESVTSSPSSSTVTCIKLKQLSKPFRVCLKPSSKDKQMDSHKARSTFHVDLPSTPGMQDAAHKHESQWAHSCDEEKQAEKTIERDSRKPPMSAKSGMENNFEHIEEGSRIAGRSFLADVITSIDQQHHKHLSPVEMEKRLAQRNIELKVISTPHNLQEQSKEKQKSNPKCEQDDTAKACVTTEDASDEFFDSQNDTTTKKPLHSTENSRESVASSPSSSTGTCIKLSQLSKPFTFCLKPSPEDKRVDSRKARSIFYVDPPSTKGMQDAAHKHEYLWAHSCDEEKQAENAIERDSRKPPMSAKSGMEDNFEHIEGGSLLCYETGEGKAFKGFGKVGPPSSSNNQSIKDDDLSVNNNYCRQGKSYKRKERKSSKAIDQRESEACTHKVAKGNDIVSNASKSQVLCKLCGIKLSKPQCFYSLGSLCTDEEICETDSDDVNRHPVGDIDDFPLLAEPQSRQDTGYTSSDDFENDNRLSSKECCSVREQSKPESDSYDGDYESDNDETGLLLDKMSDDMALKPVVSVGEPIPIKDYALQEWKSDTPTSRTMKKGYDDILSRTKCQHLRQIRGDNYCAIRAALFQMLAEQCSIKNLFASDKMGKLESIPKSLTEVDQWSFANRLPVAQSEVVETLEKFLAFFKEKICEVLDISSQPERVECILSLFNNEPEEFQLLEATKLLMYDAAVQLNKRLNQGEDVPIFSVLLFARDSCESPRDLLLNHLNKTGDTGGLEQVEMCLLGFTLGVVIRVIRPSQVDKEDFMAYYPPLDDVPNYTPTVTLVAEDDRHYNVVM